MKFLPAIRVGAKQPLPDHPSNGNRIRSAEFCEPFSTNLFPGDL